MGLAVYVTSMSNTTEDKFFKMQNLYDGLMAMEYKMQRHPEPETEGLIRKIVNRGIQDLDLDFDWYYFLKTECSGKS